MAVFDDQGMSDWHWIIGKSIKMQRPKPPKLDARQLKNTLISSRNQSETAQSSLASLFLQSTPLIADSSSTLRPENTVRQRQFATSSNFSMESAPSTGKRLKLKDYIHLNGIEKRSRNKTNSLQLSHRTKTEESRTSNQTNLLPKGEKAPAEVQVQGDASQKSAQQSYSMMIRQQIRQKIAQERKRLSDLEEYLQRDFGCRSQMSQTFVFLFAIYNKMVDVNKINQDIGAQIIEYQKKKDNGTQLPFFKGEGKEKQASMQTPRIQKTASYHWQQQKKELDSPAKILGSALKMTFDLTKLLNIVP